MEKALNTTRAHVEQRLSLIRVEIRAAMERSRRVHEPQIVAVTKYLDATEMQDLSAAGCQIFGENRMQVALPKLAYFADKDSAVRPRQWHFIGPIQRNKVRALVGNFSLLHGVDSLRLAQTIGRVAEGRKICQQILLQVNISGEESKHGFRADELREQLPALKEIAGIEITGLMGMAAAGDPEAARQNFCSLRELQHELQTEELELPQLSMGMSADFPIAVEEGATLLRIGRYLYT